VVPPTWSNTEFSKQTQTAQDLKFLADLEAAGESSPSLRSPLPGQLIAQQLPILSLDSTTRPFLAIAPANLEQPVEPAAPIRVAADSPILMAGTVAPPETTLLQTGQSQSATPPAAIATPSTPEIGPATAPAIGPTLAPAMTQRLPLGAAQPSLENLDAITVTLNHDAALAATLGSVIDASRAPVLPASSAQPWGTTLGATPGQPAPLSPLSQMTPPPAVLTSAQTQPTPWSDPTVQAWLSRPLPADQPRQIAALPLTARATLNASTSNRVNNLWILHVSAKDYQQIWLALAVERGQAALAPEHGFIDYQRQAIIMPVV
jgi:hypothetical protein